MSKINDIVELPEHISPISLKVIDQYQQKYHSLESKSIMGTYQKGYFQGGSNIYIIIFIYVSIRLLIF